MNIKEYLIAFIIVIIIGLILSGCTRLSFLEIMKDAEILENVVEVVEDIPK